MKAIQYLFLILISMNAMAAYDVTLTWTSPAGPHGREDETELLVEDIAGFSIYSSTVPGVYSEPPVWIPDNLATEYTISNPDNFDRYYVITTKDTDGRESDYSIEVKTSALFVPLTASDIMYSYNADLSDAQPLQGAQIRRTTIYIFPAYSDGTPVDGYYKSFNFYCCKATDGSSPGLPPVLDNDSPFVYTVDLKGYKAGEREFYTDATRNSDSGLWDSITVLFDVIVGNPKPPGNPGHTSGRIH